MKKNKQFYTEYNAFVQNMLEKGFAKKVESTNSNENNVWYIPHHAVYHPTKGKIRVVFNCAVTFLQNCLNNDGTCFAM